MDGAEGRISHPFPTPPGEGEAVEAAPGLLWMRLPLPMALNHVNVYALSEGPGWTLIDTGMDSRKSRAIWERLLAGPLGGRPVTRVVLTHYHPDHIGLAGWFQARGAELFCTRITYALARMLQLDVQPLPTPAVLSFWRAAGMPPPELARRAEERPFNFADCTAPLEPGFIRLAEGETIAIGGRDWRVRFSQGHAADHATFWCGSENLVIGGDQLLPGISPNLSVYAAEPMADPVGEWLSSLAALTPHAREDQLVLPGHKLPYKGLPARLAQLAGHHREALFRLKEFLAVPATAVDCFPALFKREIGPGEYTLALGEAVAHLNHLLRRGDVSRRMREDGAWLWQRA
jgi:glyoxylase-like metal-dependent hydrolase (beta-lactamase superfamily II)